MIDVISLGKSYGARTLFENASLKLIAGERYGLVGANGSGKTTFLKIVAGDLEASEGGVTIARPARVGVLRQDRFMNDAEAVIDVAMAGDDLVTKALAEQRALADKADGAARIADLEDAIAMHDGYTLEARASAILEGLGIPTASHRAPLGTLSGGFKLRVLLAQVLLGGPDVLLLDEPTNHLDILSIHWLELFLASYKGCAVVISHDARFLDHVASRILDVDYETITEYVGNYSAFRVEKAAVYERKAAEIARAEAEVAEKRAWVERFGAKATKARQAQSRLKQIEKIEVKELDVSSRRAPSFAFTAERPSGKDVLSLLGISKAFGSKKVLEGVTLTVRRGERVAILGKNGLGKSTLLKIATGDLEADQGSVKWGHETSVGYFPQDHREVLTDPETTPLEVIWAAVPSEATSYVRGQLGRALFSGKDVEKKVGSLSGGEAARLVFARIMVDKPNVLLLDEPTNHLDLESIEALVAALRGFDGTLVFVSHDRAFVSAVATRVVEVTEGGFRDFPGSYDEFLARSGDDHLDSSVVVLREKAAKKEKAPTKPNEGPSWEEQKRRNNRRKQLPQKRDEVMAAIEAAEARKRAIHARYAEPHFFERVAAAEISALEEEERGLTPRIDALMKEWERIEAELAEIVA